MGAVTAGLTYARTERLCQYGCGRKTRGRDAHGVATCQPCETAKARGLLAAATRTPWGVR